MDDSTRRAGAEEGPVVVYWRPGCYFCTLLLRALDQAAVRYELLDIWQDESARAFVRAHNRGDETVPTVALGEAVRTNPDPRGYIDWLAAAHPDLLGGAVRDARARPGVPGDV